MSTYKLLSLTSGCSLCGELKKYARISTFDGKSRPTRSCLRPHLHPHPTSSSTTITVSSWSPPCPNPGRYNGHSSTQQRLVFDTAAKLRWPADSPTSCPGHQYHVCGSGDSISRATAIHAWAHQGAFWARWCICNVCDGRCWLSNRFNVACVSRILAGMWYSWLMDNPAPGRRNVCPSGNPLRCIPSGPTYMGHSAKRHVQHGKARVHLLRRFFAGSVPE